MSFGRNTLKSGGCKPKNGKLYCKYKHGEADIEIVVGPDENNKLIPLEQNPSEPVDPGVLQEATHLALNSAKLKRDSMPPDGEFGG